MGSKNVSTSKRFHVGTLEKRVSFSVLFKTFPRRSTVKPFSASRRGNVLGSKNVSTSKTFPRQNVSTSATCETFRRQKTCPRRRQSFGSSHDFDQMSISCYITRGIKRFHVTQRLLTWKRFQNAAGESLPDGATWKRFGAGNSCGWGNVSTSENVSTSAKRFHVGRRGNVSHLRNVET